MFQAAERVLLSIWMGGMWAIGYLAVPVLFHSLDDRILAGMLAGKMFTILNFAGLFCAGLLLIGLFYQQGRVALSNWRSWILLAMLLLIVVAEFILQPQMAGLKQNGLNGESLQQFRWLHGISSSLFLVNSLAGLLLIIRGVYK
ncbi:Putative transmembrane protein [hydrothermal vent metagenome]|uniref:Transmembrane protein n=1 Tax=hydrothermal vent metagenome TaxID=652676 RepID=A0A3B1CAS5_9ZZZZ